MKPTKKAASALIVTAAAIGLVFGTGVARGQYVMGGWGGNGWGGYGGLGMMGMSLYDQQMVKENMWMQGAANYNMMNAQAAQSYSSANLMQQQAINTALQNEQLSSQIAQDKYNLYTQAKNKAIAEARARAPKIPLNSLIASDGTVLWPDVAPSGGVHADRRAAADRAIKAAYLDFRDSGQADVSDVVDAKQALQKYGHPALALLQARGDARTRGSLRDFLNAVDSAIDAMGDPPQKGDDKAQSRGSR